MLLNEETRKKINETLFKEYDGLVATHDEYTIAYWSRSLSISLNTRDKRHCPQSRIDKVVQAFPEIFSSGVYVKCDGTSPDFVRYDYTPALVQEIEQMRKEYGE